MINIETHLRALVRLALADQLFADAEKSMIYGLAKAHKVKEVVIDQIVKEEFARGGGSAQIEFNALTFEQRFEFIYNVVQLMKIDSEVYLSEIRYCEQMAEKLGFDKGAVKMLSKRIYSDPKITANHDMLMRELKKFDKNPH